MDILPSCQNCSNPFTPRNSRKKFCITCIQEPCEQCGGNKDTRARLCKPCLKYVKALHAKPKPSFEPIPCELCNLPFVPRDSRQRYCLPCGAKPCPQCGNKKRTDAKLCNKCTLPHKTERAKSLRFSRSQRLPAIPCEVCNNPFSPNNRTEQRCPVCVQRQKRCQQCGTAKRSRGPHCKKCDGLSHIDDGKTGQWNRREEKSIEQIISESEALGLIPEKQYAFGYVIGVVFGDGSVFTETNRIPHVRSDGTTRYHDSTVYRIRLQVISQTFAERFAKHWGILTGKSPNVWENTRTNFQKSTLRGRREEYIVKLFNVGPRHVLLGKYLFHLKHESELYELLRFPLDVMQGIIHGMIDSEGTISPKSPRHINIYNKRATLLDVLAIMLNLLGYKATVYSIADQMFNLVTYMNYQKFIG